MLMLYFFSLLLSVWDLPVVWWHQIDQSQRQQRCEVIVMLWDQVRIGLMAHLETNPTARGQIDITSLGLPSCYDRAQLQRLFTVHSDDKGAFICMDDPPPGLAYALSHFYVRPTYNALSATPSEVDIAFLVVLLKNGTDIKTVLRYKENPPRVDLPTGLPNHALVLYIERGA